jgi:hypothetical protein
MDSKALSPAEVRVVQLQGRQSGYVIGHWVVRVSSISDHTHSHCHGQQGAVTSRGERCGVEVVQLQDSCVV